MHEPAIKKENAHQDTVDSYSSPQNPEVEESGAAEDKQDIATLNEDGHNESKEVEDDGEEDDEDEDDGEEDDDEEDEVEKIITRINRVLDISHQQQGPDTHTTKLDLASIAELISTGRAKRIICMCGAGISVSAGIPDFRTPGTGLYSQLKKYKLPRPEAVFDIDFFKKNPRPFYLLAKELYPGNFAPTLTHHFMHLLHTKNLLHRCYTQNIDSLENQAGLPREAVIAAHGNFDAAHCIECRSHHDVHYVKSAVYEQEPCYCIEKKGCEGLVKPAIVFFGEQLPERFWKMVPIDFEEADLLIVMGTSLVVQPFASLIDRVKDDTPRLLINRENVGGDSLSSILGKGFDFSSGSRDVFLQGNCDDGVRELCRLLGWEEELDDLVLKWGNNKDLPEKKE